MADPEKLKIYRSVVYPAMLLAVMWIVRLADMWFDLGLNEYGLYPLQARGLPGILTSPLLHADLAHLFANSIPFLVLGSFLFFFYREIAWLILALLWLLTGAWVWVLARGGTCHIGASGVVYGLAAFLFFSGLIRRERGLLVITMLVAFLYGGLVWGVFPQLFPDKPISWESHLMGFVAGLVLAVYYRREGPQRRQYEWEDEEDEEDETEEDGGDPPGKDAGVYHESWDNPQVRYHPPEK
mgnify:CR=1 FL=1